MIEGHEQIPYNYFALVKAARERLNAQADEWSVRRPEPGEVEKYEEQEQDLDAVREIAAQIRDEGFVRGQRHHHDNKVLDLATVVGSNPYPRGSGAAQVWVRGYIQGRSVKQVIDPRPYIEAA